MSITILLDDEGNLQHIVVPEGETAHIVQGEDREAVLFYDETRDVPPRGYDRLRHCTYDAPITVGPRLSFVLTTTPVQPVS